MQRPIIFDGLKSGNVSPTDIDSIIELYNKLLIIFEIKENNKDITIGQQITTTRIIDSWNSSKDKIGLVILAHHNPEDTQIMMKDCIISKIYIENKWKPLIKPVKVSQFLKILGNKFNIEHLKNLN
jgi:hypothetical protein